MMQSNNLSSRDYQHLTLKFDEMPNMCHILQGGFKIFARVGVSIKNLLCEQLHFDSSYVENRISTIFLDGKPVDDIDAAKLSEGSILALSAAMPGLVGATMRKGGHYSSLRQSIAHQQKSLQAQSKEALITLKLFNVVAEELGPEFLEQGVLVKREHLQSFFETRRSAFYETCRSAVVDGRELDPKDLQSSNWIETPKLIKFKVVKLS